MPRDSSGAASSDFDRMTHLALMFPSLAAAPGAQPWDALKLDSWTESVVVTQTARCSAQFVLTVWNAGVGWDCGCFNIIEAFRCWDVAHRCAFLQWAAAPWWP